MKTCLKIAGNLFLLLLLLSCSKKKSEGGDPGNEKGYATGKVTKADGTAFAGVKIIVDNTMLYNSYVAATSDEKGFYKVKLPTVGTFHAVAYIEKTYNGKKYKLDFLPDNDDEFSIDGGVRNFKFTLTGERPDGLGYYGGTIYVDKDVLSSIYDTENIELTLVPAGPLVDGSQGQTLKLKPGQPGSDDYGRLVDVPIGRYNISAQHISGSVRKPLKLRNSITQGAYLDVMQIDFDPSNMWGTNVAAVEYKE